MLQYSIYSKLEIHGQSETGVSTSIGAPSGSYMNLQREYFHLRNLPFVILPVAGFHFRGGDSNAIRPTLLTKMEYSYRRRVTLRLFLEFT